jgi:amiloride-sensitive sodium channel
MRGIPFPAITICSPVFAKDNLVNYIKFGKFFDQTGKNMTAREQNYFAANYQACNPSNDLGDYDVISRYLQDRTDFDIKRLLEESSLQMYELMLLCGKNGTITHCEDLFNRVLLDYGFCYTFNMQHHGLIYTDIVSESFKGKKSKAVKENWTLDKGYAKDYRGNAIPHRALKNVRFTALMNLKAINAENICPVLGKVFMVILHKPNEIPTFFHNEYFVPFNHITTYQLIAISYRANEEIRKYSPITRGCYFQDERKLKFFKTYTKSQCDIECLTNYTLKSCGCVKFSMPHEQSTPICDIDDMACYSAAKDRWPEDDEDEQIACNCLQTCNDISYRVKYTKESRLDYAKEMLGNQLRPAK